MPGKAYGSFGLLLLLGLIFTGRIFKDNLKYRKTLHYSLLKIPVLGTYITKVYLAQFTQAVALLTTAKIPLLNSIQMVKKMIRFVPLQDALDKVEINILKGNSCVYASKKIPYSTTKLSLW